MKRLNPYNIFSVGLIITIVIYLFNLSDLYPPFSLVVILFLGFTVVLFFILGFKFRDQYSQLTLGYEKIWKNKKYVVGTIFSMIGTLLEGIYSHGYALFKYSSVESNFGIPTFHVALTLYIAFLSICAFESLLVSDKANKQKLLCLITINISCLLLNLSRFILVIVFMTCIWLTLFRVKQKFTLKKACLVIVSVMTFLYLFGILGNYRSNLQLENKNNDVLDSTLIFEVGGAKNNIRDNKLLGPLFWDYIYISSPLANFQNIVSANPMIENTHEEMLLSQYIPGKLGASFFPDYALTTGEQYLITPLLNVSTIFFYSYYISGWIGVILMVLYMSIFPYIYIYLIKKISPSYLEIGMALLNTVYLLSLFDNMFINVVTSGLLAFPFLASLCSKIKVNIKYEI